MLAIVRSAQALAVLAAAALVLAIAPGDGRAEKSALKQCTDNAWAEYNECLMETDWEFARKGCDFSFGMEYEKCHIIHWREALGIA